MEKHTEGRIASGGESKYLYDGEENVMAYIYSGEADMNRLAAAWNAVDGIPTERLQPGAVKALIGAMDSLLLAVFDKRSAREEAMKTLAPFTEGVTHP